MSFLGFSDDMLDLRWRYKIILPMIASFPLIFAYTGSTSILLPKMIIPILGSNLLDLGFIFRVYMSMLAIFCTNSINIYAGINGLEVGQSLIIGISIIFYNLIELTSGHVEVSLFSLSLMIPFVMTSFALFMFNKYPSDCFIGDTYCYFAGMTFACAGILGHYSKTLLLFFIPQILNFVLSIPQVLAF
jgi:UDP-N-acetylglucosamine--dolichyl-phosphate N-acetylglucosaminephosphotransferase